MGYVVHATKAMGVKVVNPGGISAFKFNQRKLDVDERPCALAGHAAADPAARWRGRCTSWAWPHPLHIHASNLGVPGNIDSRPWPPSMRSMACRGHLTHVQFHAYGKEGPKKFSSAALRLAETVNATPNVSHRRRPDPVRQTVTASGDTMRQHANSDLGSPRKWIGADIECDAGCGVVPFRYREQSYVNALQWCIGLELFLLIEDPWRIVLTTDHPNGAPVHQLPAPDPAADGQGLPRRTARDAAPRRGGAIGPARTSRASSACRRSPS